MQRHMSSAVGVALGAVVVTGVGLSPASAQEEEHARETAELIETVRPSEVTNDSVIPGGVEARTEAGSAVKVPSTSAGALTLRGESGADISVVLPGNGAEAVVAPDGTVVYGDEGGVTVAAQSGEGAARVHTVMAEAEDVEDVEYTFPDLTPELNADGTVTLFATSDDGSFQASVGYIEAPWAADANGEALETNYRVEGDSVFQEVVVDDSTAFPVVADPAFQGDCGIVTCTVRFDRAWTVRMRDFGGDTGAMIGGLTAAGAAIGGGAGAVIGAGAGVIIGGRASIFSTQAGDFYSNGNCFGIKFPASAPGLGWGTQVTRGTYNCA